METKSRKEQALAIPAEAEKYAEAQIQARRAAIMQEYRELAKHPAPKPGQVYEVISGMRSGDTGMLIWAGSTKWGKQFMLAASEEKLPNGRYAHVFYSRPSNLRWIDPTRDARRAELDKEMQELSPVDPVDNFSPRKQTIFAAELLRQYEELAKSCNVPITLLLKRTLIAINEEVKQTKEYLDDLVANHWACDGPAYEDVLQRSRAFDRYIKRLKRAIAVIEEKYPNLN